MIMWLPTDDKENESGPGFFCLLAGLWIGFLMGVAVTAFLWWMS